MQTYRVRDLSINAGLGLQDFFTLCNLTVQLIQETTDVNAYDEDEIRYAVLLAWTFRYDYWGNGYIAADAREIFLKRRERNNNRPLPLPTRSQQAMTLVKSLGSALENEHMKRYLIAEGCASLKGRLYIFDGSMPRRRPFRTYVCSHCGYQPPHHRRHRELVFGEEILCKTCYHFLVVENIVNDGKRD